VVGMSACLGAVVRAPITSILIVFEMTHEFTFVPVLMLAAVCSQAISRLLLPDNFYSDVLRRDGVHLEKIIPPRTLAQWQQQEAASIANFRPVLLSSLDNTTVSELLAAHAHSRFPWTQDGQLRGIVSRTELQEYLDSGHVPVPAPMASILPEDSIATARQKLIDSDHGLLVLTRDGDSQPMAVLTLHDLLRAEDRAVEIQERD